MGKEIFTLESLNFQLSLVILSFYLSSSFLPLKKYVFFEVSLDCLPTSEMGKIQHAPFSLRHLRLNWLRRRKNHNRRKKWFSNPSLSQTIAKSAKRASATMRSMWSTKFTRKKWIKTNFLDISKDLSRIFKLSRGKVWRGPDRLERKGRILTKIFNRKRKRLWSGSRNSGRFQLLKYNLK